MALITPDQYVMDVLQDLHASSNREQVGAVIAGSVDKIAREGAGSYAIRRYLIKLESVLAGLADANDHDAAVRDCYRDAIACIHNLPGTERLDDDLP